MDDKILAATIALALLVVFVAFPMLIAAIKRHPDRALIYRLAPLSLLSFLLWFALIAWAFSGQRDDAVITKYVARLRANNRLPWLIGALVVAGLVGSLVTWLY